VSEAKKKVLIPACSQNGNEQYEENNNRKRRLSPQTSDDETGMATKIPKLVSYSKKNFFANYK
jgi:hypothetical protein